MVNAWPFFKATALLICFGFFTQSAFTQDALIPSDNAIRILNAITVRVLLSGNQVGTAFFIDPTGIALTHTAVLKDNTNGVILLADGKKIAFDLLYNDPESGFGLIIVSSESNLPKLPRCTFRDPAKLKETELLISRSCVAGNSLYTFVGSLAYLSPNNPRSSEMLVQMPKTEGGGGSPFLDIDGNVVGYLREAFPLESTYLPMVSPYSRVLTSVTHQQEYSQTFENIFSGITFGDKNLTCVNVDKRSNSELKVGDVIKSVNEVAVSCLHDLKMACWAASSRKLDTFKLEVISDKQTSKHLVKLK